MQCGAVNRLLAVVAAVAFAWIGACHHDAAAPIEPAAPGERPPLPPASGTPIGFLLDDTSLKLSDDQATQLRAIDTSLSARLESIDAQTRAANRPSEEAASPAPQGGGGGRHGGRGGGMGGGGGGGGGGGRHHKSGGGGGSGASPSSAAAVNRLADERNADVKDALTRAFAVLDSAQQVVAKKVLSEHDVDLDVGSTASAAHREGGEADPPPEP